MPDPNPAHVLKVGRGRLRDMRLDLIALTRCAATDNARPAIASVAFGKDRATATDAFCLGLVDLDGQGPDEQRVVPAKELAEALRQAKPKDDVEIVFEDTEATVVVITASLYGVSRRTRTLPYYSEGKFPDTDSLLAKHGGRRGTQGEPPLWRPEILNRVTALAGDEPVALHWTSDLTAAVVVTAGLGASANDRLVGLVMPINRGAAR